MKIIQRPRGTQDIYGEYMEYWHFVESHIKTMTTLYQYEEIRTPMFERIEVFARSVGETSDIVSKEMYEFEDKKGRHMALKPESTAAIVRAYVENKLYAVGDYQKFYYISPTFRYERAQTGRYRQHHQFGFEVFGEKNPAVDCESILFVDSFMKKIGLSGYHVKINSLGDNESRTNYRQALQDHFTPVIGELCSDCAVRLEKNPLRILDCKVDSKHESMLTAPKLSDYLTPSATAYFQQVVALLDTFSVPYEIDETLVRGLDYYTHTVFEFVLDNKTSAKAGSLAGGGRYDGLVEQFGGPEKSGFGCGIGMERLILALQDQNVEIKQFEPIKVLVGNIANDDATLESMKIVQALRSAGIIAEMNIQPKSMKAIFKLADRMEATHLILIGEDEMNSDTVSIRNTTTREQETLKKDKIVDFFK